ncbi:MAG: CDP-archaeol synthase [Pseudomonas sp.]|uniref:CDP-archaeol synthase n=1 Tax=Pseudomonas sp. TaxID=306 RepID=UPI0033916731
MFTLFDAMLTALYLMIPLILSGSLHMLVVSRHWLAPLAVPINQPAFGANKTWRGIVVMPLATVPGVYLAQWLEPLLAEHLLASLVGLNPWLLGLALGIGYVLAELPNSYIKRRLNIQPGKQPERHAFWFGLMDQADSAIGCALVYWLLLNPGLWVILAFILLGPLLHLVINLLLYSLGLRKQPF